MIGFDLSLSALNGCTDLGASAAVLVADVAGHSYFVTKTLPRMVEEVTLGPTGIATNPKPGTVFIDSSTSSPVTAKLVHPSVARFVVSCSAKGRFRWLIRGDTDGPGAAVKRWAQGVDWL